MKKILLYVFLFFIPLVVNSSTCDLENVFISDIKLLDKSQGVVVSSPDISGSNVILNLKLKQLDDSVKYSITIKNNSSEEFLLSQNINNNYDYISYNLSSDNNIIKPNESTSAVLTVTYKKEIPDTLFENNKYNEVKTLSINLLSDGEFNNPKTGIYNYAFILIMCIIGFSFIYLIINKNKYSKYFVLLLMFVPLCIYASCEVNVSVTSNIEIEKEVTDFLMPSLSGLGTGNFFRTNILKQDVEKITFSGSTEGYTINGVDCFDVSLNENGSVIAKLEDSDSNGLYEVTIAQNGKVYASSNPRLFHYLINLKMISNIEYLDTSYTTDMSSMFLSCESLESVDLSHFNTSNVNKMESMFSNCESLESIDLSSFDTSNVTSMRYMFFSSDNLSNINVSSFNTSKVTSMFGMFAVCGINNIDVSNFNTSNVTNMTSMFQNCTKLLALDLRNFDTSKVNRFDFMFDGCTNLEYAKVSSFTGTSATSTKVMFQNCKKLDTINLSNFITSDVTDMSFMFYGCQSLTTLIISNFDTSKVTNMKCMFYDCRSLTELDLSNFDTSLVTDISYMFNRCYELVTIYASDKFVTNNVTKSTYMFLHDSKLVGGKGSKLSGNPSDKTCAHIDEGESNPGFFTRIEL